MRVLIKNVQLEKEFPKVANYTLETCPESLIKEIARAYQIGTQKRVKVVREIELYGERKPQTSYKFVNRTKVELLKEIRRRAKICIDIPREYWTDEQYEAFLDEGILDNMDINVEIDFKKSIGVYKDLMPYENLPRSKQDDMFIEVSMDAWEYFSNTFNYKNDVDKNKLRVKRWRPLLYPQEFVWETEEEKEQADKMNAAINAKTGGDSLKLDKAMKYAGDSEYTTEDEPAD
jgi:hypothetical protein